MSNARRVSRWAATAMVAAGLLLMSGVWPASAAGVVTAVNGSAYGYRAFNIALLGNPQPDTGPTPTVTLASDASNSPQSASAANGHVTYGPATLFTSDSIAVQATGSLGSTGAVTSTSSVNNINKSTTQPTITGSEQLTADNISSSCSASASASASGSTTATNATVETESGSADPNPPTVVSIPTNPSVNYTVNGQIDLSATDTETFTFVFNEQTTDASGNLTVNAVDEYLHGPTAKGNVIIGQSVCGATTAPNTDFSVQNPGITHSPATVTGGQSVVFTVTVTNLGPADASGASDTTTATGGKVTGMTSSSGTCGMSKKTKAFTCTFGTIAANGSATVQVTVAAPRKSGSTVSVSSTVSYVGDTNAANNTATDSVTVQ